MKCLRLKSIACVLNMHPSYIISCGSRIKTKVAIYSGLRPCNRVRDFWLQASGSQSQEVKEERKIKKLSALVDEDSSTKQNS